MLKTVQLRVEDPVALTGSFVRRDAFLVDKAILKTVQLRVEDSIVLTGPFVPRELGDAQGSSTPYQGPLGANGPVRAPRRLSASAAMLKTVQLRVEGPVAFTGSFERETLYGERGDAQDGSTPCRGPFGAHLFLRAPRRLWASAAMLNHAGSKFQGGSTPCRGPRGAYGLLRAPRRLWASAAMLKTVQLSAEDPVALAGSFVRRDSLRRARRCSRRFNSVSRTPWRSRAPSCAATPYGERGDAQDVSTPYRRPRGAHGLLRAPRRLWASAAMLKTVHFCVEDPMTLTGFFVRRDTPFGERGDAQDGSTPCREPRGAHGLLRAPRRLPVGAAMPFGGFNALHDAAEEPSAGMINPFLLGAAHSATPDYFLAGTTTPSCYKLGEARGPGRPDIPIDWAGRSGCLPP